MPELHIKKLDRVWSYDSVDIPNPVRVSIEFGLFAVVAANELLAALGNLSQGDQTLDARRPLIICEVPDGIEFVIGDKGVTVTTDELLAQLEAL